MSVIDPHIKLKEAQRRSSEAINTAHVCQNNPGSVASRIVLMYLGHFDSRGQPLKCFWFYYPINLHK